MPGSTRASMPCWPAGGGRATFVRGRRGRVVAVSFGMARARGVCVVCSVWFRLADWLVMILQVQHSTLFFNLLYESAAESRNS